MKRSYLLLWVLWVAGCQQTPMQEYEYQLVRIKVGGRVNTPQARSTATPTATFGEEILCDIPQRQIMIEAKLVGVNRESQSILGIDFLPDGKTVLPPAGIENTSGGGSPPISLGLGVGAVGLGGAGGRSSGSPSGHPPGCTCAQCRGGGHSRSGSGLSPSVGGGVSVPLGGQGEGGITSMRATFFDDAGGTDLNHAQVLIQVIIGRTGDDRILVQPLVFPIQTLPAGEDPPPRQAQTAVKIVDGQTVVIGGLNENREKGDSKVPAIGDIPALGKLFRQSSDRVQRKELIIFVTPRIIIQEEE